MVRFPPRHGDLHATVSLCHCRRARSPLTDPLSYLMFGFEFPIRHKGIGRALRYQRDWFPNQTKPMFVPSRHWPVSEVCYDKTLPAPQLLTPGFRGCDSKHGIQAARYVRFRRRPR